MVIERHSSSGSRSSSVAAVEEGEDFRSVAVVPPTSVVRKSLERRLSNRSLNAIASLRLPGSAQVDSKNFADNSSSVPSKPQQPRILIPLDRVVLPAKCQPLIDVNSDDEFEDVFLSSASRKGAAIGTVSCSRERQILLKDGFEFASVSSAESDVEELSSLTGNDGTEMKDTSAKVKQKNIRRGSLKQAVRRSTSGDSADAGDDLQLIPPHSIVGGTESKLKTCLDSVYNGLCLGKWDIQNCSIS